MDSGIYSTNMRAHPMITVFRHALNTFLPKADEKFSANFMKLKESLDKIKADHVDLDPAFKNTIVWNAEKKAPCTYIEIFEDENINMGIFILKPGFKMPLHDHPHMHGLLKVISGTARVKSYNEIPHSPALESLLNSQNDNSPAWRNPKYNKSFFAQLMQDVECTEDSESCILTPDVSNYHEIQAVNGPSAFLDILAPPYSAPLNDCEPRQCHYYEIARDLGNKLYHLQETAPPNWFFCDQAPYLGPELNVNQVMQVALFHD